VWDSYLVGQGMGYITSIERPTRLPWQDLEGMKIAYSQVDVYRVKMV